MTHEIIHLVKHVWEGQQQGLQSVLATVVALEGSSYRRPGVRMLIQDNGNTIGAVSGGCVEKEVQRQAQSVFESGVPKVMTYDGRLRLGCEGVIFILLEPIRLTPALQSKFETVFQNRMTFESTTFYEPAPQKNKSFGTQFFFEGVPHALRDSFSTPQENLQSFKQTFPYFSFIYSEQSTMLWYCVKLLRP
ncbi:MAG: XdhC family protein [Flavobacteriaceae bacterium]